MEASSPTRRVYLFVLFGVVGVAALIALLVAVYQLFVDVVSGTLGGATLRNMRWGIGILAMAGGVAAYHWRVYQGERDFAPSLQRRTILLVGLRDAAIRDALEDQLGCKVQQWPSVDLSPQGEWTLDAVSAAVEAVQGNEIVVTSDGQRLRAIAVER